MSEMRATGVAVSERLVSDEALAALIGVVDKLTPAVYERYAQQHGLDPAEVHGRQECEGVSDDLLVALAARGIRVRMQEFQGPAPDERHYFLGWGSVVIDPTWQQSIEGKTEEERRQLPRTLVCREADLAERLTSYGVPAHKLNRWLDARDRPARITP